PNGPYTPAFGYTLTARSLPVPPLSDFNPDADARIYFAAGGTRRYVFDAHADSFLAGTYTLQGSFVGTRSAPTAVRLPPRDAWRAEVPVNGRDDRCHIVLG
ncbi:MAG TPA: hypothetical protein VGD56_16240, partial [Gemmatirosa sp.]